MRLKFTLVLVLLALAVVTLAPPALKAQAVPANQDSFQPSPAAPEDPHGNRPADSRSESAHLQVPDFLRNLQPVVPPPPREGLVSVPVGDTIEYDSSTKQARIISAPAAPQQVLAPGQTASVAGFAGLLPTADVSEDVLKLSVIGVDDRVRITPTTSFPWRTVVYIALNWGSGFTSWCTGAMIDSSHVLTAGHCVNNGSGTWVSDLLVYPGRDGSYTPYYSARWSIIRSYSNWTNGADWNHDWAVITLDRNVGNYTGWMGRITWGCNFFLSYCDSHYLGIWNNAGYGQPAPDGLPNNGRMFFDADYGQTANETKHWYYIDTEGGNSGGPVWYFDGTNRYIGTVHAYGNGGACCNSGTRLNQDKFDRINTWLGADTPPVDYPDLIDDGQPYIYASPLTVTGGVTSMAVGSDVRNIGTGGASGFWVQYVLSSDSFISTGDYTVCYAWVAGVSAFTWNNSDCTGSPSSSLPNGMYWLGVIIDPFGNQTEFNESNNTAISSFQVKVVNTVTVVATDATATEAGPTTGTLTFTRSGSTASALTVNYSVGGTATNGVDYVSLPGSITIPAGLSQASVLVTPVLDALIETETVVVTIVSSSNYLIGGPGSATVYITDGPDLVVDSIRAPTIGGRGVSITVEAVTKNIGNSAAGPTSTSLYFSANKTIDGGDVVIGSISIPSLVPGATYSGSLAFTIPTTPVDGSTWYILSKADAGLAVPETSEVNNTKKLRAIKIGPDLIISKIVAPTTVTVGTTISVTEVTKNNGATVGAAGPSVTRLYLSVDKVLDSGDVLLSGRGVPALAANAASSFTHVVTLPGATTGSLYILAVADSTGVVVEAVETNNVKSKALTIVP